MGIPRRCTTRSRRQMSQPTKRAATSDDVPSVDESSGALHGVLSVPAISRWPARPLARAEPRRGECVICTALAL
jgi:hypothetical protein